MSTKGDEYRRAFVYFEVKIPMTPTVTPKQRLEVSRRLREDYSNGSSYYPLNGSAVRAPDAKSERPDGEYLRWHNEHVYLG